MMGSEIHIHGELDNGKSIIQKVQIADMSDEEQAKLLNAREVIFSVRERTINIFDPEDGRNLAVPDAVAVPSDKKAEVK